MKPFRAAGAIGAYACLHTGLALAQNPSPIDVRACAGIETDSQRLLCYDKAVGRDQLPQAVEEGRPQRGIGQRRPGHAQFGEPRQAALAARQPLGTLTRIQARHLQPARYKPTYALPFFGTTKQNTTPHSPAPDHTVTTPQELQSVEAKFQISLKTKVAENLFDDNGDVWVGYAQSSRWQVYNTDNSRPFRETNYEPEALLVFNTNYQVLGWTGRLAGIGINHQSNGRADPLSRSWNRVVADIGLEREGWTIIAAPMVAHSGRSQGRRQSRHPGLHGPGRDPGGA